MVNLRRREKREEEEQEETECQTVTSGVKGNKCELHRPPSRPTLLKVIVGQGGPGAGTDKGSGME